MNWNREILCHREKMTTKIMTSLLFYFMLISCCHCLLCCRHLMGCCCHLLCCSPLAMLLPLHCLLLLVPSLPVDCWLVYSYLAVAVTITAYCTVAPYCTIDQTASTAFAFVASVAATWLPLFKNLSLCCCGHGHQPLCFTNAEAATTLTHWQCWCCWFIVAL